MINDNKTFGAIVSVDDVLAPLIFIRFLCAIVRSVRLSVALVRMCAVAGRRGSLLSLSPFFVCLCWLQNM